MVLLNIIVIDSPMGSGKTSWAINNMRMQQNPFIFFTPYLTEVDRIKQGVSNKQIKAPSDGKIRSFKKLISYGQNIATTHALFDKISLSEEDKQSIKQYKYVCYLDEAIDAIQPVVLSKKNKQTLLNEYVTVDQQTGKVTWIEQDDDSNDRFSDIRDSAKAGTCYCCNKEMFITCFPVQKLQLFDTVYIMTFLFESTNLNWLLESKGIPYQVKHIEYRSGQYILVDGKADIALWKKHVRSLLHIYQGKMNLQNNFTLSSNWWSKSSDCDKQTVIKRMDYVFRKIYKTKQKDCFYTLFKQYQNKYCSTRYNHIKCYIPCNLRATNEYAGKHCMAYLVQVNINPFINNWLKQNNIIEREQLFTLSILLQWIWRSAIRNDEQVYLYLPANRLRQNLIDWLEKDC